MLADLKKLFVNILLLILVVPNVVFGQLGIKVGVALSGYQPSQNLSGEYTHDYRPFLGYEIEWLQDDEGSPDIGLQLGVFYTVTISKYFDFQPEIYYSQRGIHFYKTKLYNISYNLNVAYLEMPILFKYKIPFDWAVAPGLQAGPYFSLTLSSKRTLDFGDESDTKSVDGVNNYDYGLLFALNFEFPELLASPLLELRFNWGLANTMRQPEEYTNLYEDPGTIKLYALTLLTGFRIL